MRTTYQGESTVGQDSTPSELNLPLSVVVVFYDRSSGSLVKNKRLKWMLTTLETRNESLHVPFSQFSVDSEDSTLSLRLFTITELF